MVRPLTGLVAGVVFLIMIGTAFGQGSYGGNYPGAYQYDPYSQGYANGANSQQGAYQGYGQSGAYSQYGQQQQYGYPGYGQGVQAQSGYGAQDPYGYTQSQPGTAAYQNYQNYQNYPGYGDYMGAMQRAYGSTGVDQSYQGYGTPGGSYQQQPRYAPVQRSQTRQAATQRQAPRVARESVTSPVAAAGRDFGEDTLVAKEIYWNPNAQTDSSADESVQAQPQAAPIPIARPRATAQRQTVQKPRALRSTARSKARSAIPAPPSSSKSLSWGRNQEERVASKPKPESRRSFKWGKEAKPAMVTSEPGSTTVRNEISTPVGQQVKAEERAPVKRFQWGKPN